MLKYKKNNLKYFALLVKENTKVLSVIGFAFFSITSILGVVWIFHPNNDLLEPITFVLGACSTIFFGVPQLAEFILPTRKPIRHMTYDELIQFILSTDSKGDWHSIVRENIEEYFLKEDPRLRIVTKNIDDGIHLIKFIEEWANSHSDSKAISYYYNILFDGHFIHRLVLVSVDGGRAILPLPNKITMKVDRFDYKIAHICARGNNTDDYMQRSGINL